MDLVHDYVDNPCAEQTLHIRNTVSLFPLGTNVRKIKGSEWNGKVVGYYSTKLTPHGVAIESHTEKGSVQIYPIATIERVA